MKAQADWHPVASFSGYDGQGNVRFLTDLNGLVTEVFDQQYLRLLNNFLEDFEHAFDREFRGLA